MLNKSVLHILTFQNLSLKITKTMAVAVINKYNERLSPKEFNALCGTNFSWDDLFYFDWGQLTFKVSHTWEDEKEFCKNKLHGKEHIFEKFSSAATQYARACVGPYGKNTTKTLECLKSELIYIQNYLKELAKLYDNGLRIQSLNQG